MLRVAALLALLAPASALAAPGLFSHQGRIFDQTGVPLDGDVLVQFTLYDAPAGGAVVWTEDRTVGFDGGHYHLLLGETTPLEAALLDGGDLFLGIRVNGGTELPTRLALVSVPYALSAENVHGGIVDASEVRIAGSAVISSAGTISFGALTDVPQMLSGLACSANEVARFDGTSWGCAADNAHEHDASALTSGTLDIDRLPVGTGTGQVAAGGHDHDISTLSGSLSFDDLSGDLTLSSALVADGGVKLGAPGTCESTEEGTLSYDSGRLVVCDGAEWVPQEIYARLGAAGDAVQLTDGMYLYSVRGNTVMTQAFSHDFYTCGASHVLHIEAAMTHWSAEHRTTSKRIFYMDSYTTLSSDIILENSTSNAGSWSYERIVTGNNGHGDTSDRLRITHNAGSYAGGANYYIYIRSTCPVVEL